LIDTPGFDDSRFDDDIIVQKILEWLRTSLEQGTTLNGIIYIHPIIKPRIGGTAGANIRMFRQLCGKDFYRNVVLATTFWEDIDLSEGDMRERELCENDAFWGPLKKRGSMVVRLGLDKRADQALLLKMAEQKKCILQAQKEMQEGKDILDTAAAKEVKEDVTNWARLFEKQLQIEDEKCRRELANPMRYSQDQLEAIRQTLERERKQQQLSQERMDYNLMKEQWLQRQREQKDRRDRRLTTLQALQQEVDLHKKNTGERERHARAHIKCRRLEVASMMCCSNYKCMRVIKPKRDQFYRKWHSLMTIISFPCSLFRADESCQTVVSAIMMTTITANNAVLNVETGIIPR
jgi:hypothetical protein